MTRSLDGAVVAVIGAGGGLGAPTARLLAARGARLVLAGPHVDRLAAVGVADAALVSLDLRAPDAGEDLVAAAMTRYGQLDGVVNAAGIVAFGPLGSTTGLFARCSVGVWRRPGRSWPSSSRR